MRISKCENCSEPTKYIYAFKDGSNGPSYIFHCKNNDCPDGKTLRDNIAREANLITETKLCNEKNGFDIEKLKTYKFVTGMTYFQLSENTGIPVTTISNYFSYHKAISSDDYDKIMDLLRSELNQ